MHLLRTLRICRAAAVTGTPRWRTSTHCCAANLVFQMPSAMATRGIWSSNCLSFLESVKATPLAMPFHNFAMHGLRLATALLIIINGTKN